MFGLYEHPATRFTCRHCGRNAGHDPEHCFYCGPICGECFISDEKCNGQIKYEKLKKAEKEAKQP